MLKSFTLHYIVPFISIRIYVPFSLVATQRSSFACDFPHSTKFWLSVSRSQQVCGQIR